MRIFLALSVIIISIQYGRCKIELKRDKEVIVDIDSPDELHQSQYHTADFDTSAYNYGYAVEPNGQFHHETRGGDGVTYGCYGYIDSDDLLKVTHYVADSQGYRTLEHEKPVLVYPVNENTVDAGEKRYKPKGVLLDWKDLYFPIGCGMAKGGLLLNAPVIRAPNGVFEQLGEKIFPVQPSAEPKVVVPPFNIPIKTEPTKLIPISTVVSTYTKQQILKTTAPTDTFSSPDGFNPLTDAKTHRPTINSNTPTKQPSNINTHVNGPEYDTKVSYQPSHESTVQTTASPSNNPTRAGTSPPTFRVIVPEYDTKVSSRQNQRPTVQTTASPTQTGTSPSLFRESANNGPSTENTPKVTPSISSIDQSDYTEDLLPPFRTTNKFNTQTTVGLPINSLDPVNDLNVINSYANLDIQTTTKPNYVGKVTTAVPIRSQPFSNSFNINGPSTVASTKYTAFDSTEKNRPIRPNNFDGFKITSQPTTETHFDLVTESNVDSTDPDSTIYTDAESLSTPAVERGSSDANQRPTDIPPYTPTKYSPSQKDSTSTFIGVTSRIASQRPAFESFTSPSIAVEYETTLQPAYGGIGDYSKPPPGFEFNIPTRAPGGIGDYSKPPPGFEFNIPTRAPGGIGDYSKPPPGFEFNIPTRAPNRVSTPKTQSFVTVSNLEPVRASVTPKSSVETNVVEDKAPANDKTTTFTNGPHGAEYQLASRNPNSQFPIKNGNPNSRNPIKNSRKDVDANDPPASLITPLTHLTMSGSLPSTYNGKTDPSSVHQQSSTPSYSDRLPSYGNQHEVINSHRPNTVQAEREPSQSSGFFTVPTPKNEPIRGIITHMNAISQTKVQSSSVPPSVEPNYVEKTSAEIQSNQPDDNSNPEGQKNVGPEISNKSHPELVKPTDQPFLYTRSGSTSENPDGTPYQGKTRPGSASPDSPNNGELTIYSKFGQRVIPGFESDTVRGNKPAQTSFTAYNPGSTATPLNEVDGGAPSANRVKGNPVSYDNLPQQPKFVLRPTVKAASNPDKQPLSVFNGYPDTVNRNANLYPDSNTQKASDTNQNNIQPESKYVNTKKEFIPQYNPGSTPIPGSFGTAIGIYPPNIDELVPEIPNFNIAISKWPFYILPFPFANGNNLMTFPFLSGMPIQLGANVLPTANFNPVANINSGNNYAIGASSVGSSGSGPPAQTICSWLSSYIKARENATKTETPTNENGETLQVSNLQANINNPQLQFSQNQIPFGIVGFIPVIAVPNCQHNVQGDTNVVPNILQLPNLCTQLGHLLGSPITAQNTNQQPSST